MLAVCCLGMTIGCGTNPSKNENVKETLPALVVNGTQLMNTEGDTVVLHGVSYGWHQFWPRFYNASSVAYLVNDWGAQTALGAFMILFPEHRPHADGKLIDLNAAELCHSKMPELVDGDHRTEHEQRGKDGDNK